VRPECVGAQPTIASDRAPQVGARALKNRGRSTISKRNREQARQERAQAKAQRRRDQAERRRDSVEPPPGEDPDISWIVPGPQKPPE
jgi:hypothetical protein